MVKGEPKNSPIILTEKKMYEYCQNIKNLERIKNFLLDPQTNHSIKEKLENIDLPDGDSLIQRIRNKTLE